MNTKATAVILVPLIIFGFIISTNISVKEKFDITKKEKRESSTLTLEEINKKYEEKQEEIRKLQLKAINAVILEEAQNVFGYDVSNYHFTSLDTFSPSFIHEAEKSIQTESNPGASFNPRYTIAYKKEDQGILFHKNPNNGSLFTFHLKYVNREWRVEQIESKEGDKYTYEFIREIQRRVKDNFNNSHS